MFTAVQEGDMSEFSNAIKLPERPPAVSLDRLWNGGGDSEAVRRARIIQEHISPRSGGAEEMETP